MRRLVAFLVAPIPILVSLGVIAMARGAGPGIAIVGIIACTVCAWLLQVLPGLQIAVWLKLRGGGSWRYLIGGTLLYSLPAVAIAGWLIFHGSPVTTLYLIMMGNLLLIGAASGLTGWLVMRAEQTDGVDLAELRERFE